MKEVNKNELFDINGGVVTAGIIANLTTDIWYGIGYAAATVTAVAKQLNNFETPELAGAKRFGEL